MSHDASEHGFCFEYGVFSLVVVSVCDVPVVALVIVPVTKPVTYCDNTILLLI